jgi:hypothetical protein
VALLHPLWACTTGNAVKWGFTAGANIATAANTAIVNDNLAVHFMMLSSFLQQSWSKASCRAFTTSHVFTGYFGKSREDEVKLRWSFGEDGR